MIPPIAVRANRVKKALNLEKPDRVPFMPMVNNYYAMGYGLSVYTAMKDLPSIIPYMEEFCKRYDPDLLYSPTFFPIDVMEQAKSKNHRWPGEYWGLPENTPYQYIDQSFIGDDDWDDYMKDPTGFLLKKVLPEKYGAFEGLKYLNIAGLCSQAPISLAGAAIPPVKAALQNLINCAQTAMDKIGDLTAIAMKAIELGYPVFGTFVPMTPFDEFADCIRGMLPTLMDLMTDPDMVMEAINRWGEISIPAAVNQGKMSHAQYAMIPLHCGMDSFMSPEQYKKYYWPSMKQMMLALIEADITPIAICEGNYNTRLETIADIPKGKVIYAFENIDLKKAKEILGDVACIAAGMPTDLLIRGTKQQVIDETKRAIDICAPGGGFIMTNSMALDDANAELLDAWYETTVTYGKY